MNQIAESAIKKDLSIKLEKKIFARITELNPIIDSICNDPRENLNLQHRNALESLEKVYFKKALLSIELYENDNWYSRQRNKIILDQSMKQHEHNCFFGHKKPNLILLVEKWCSKKKYSSFEKGIEPFQVACVLCENIIHWQRKSMWISYNKLKNNKFVDLSEEYSLEFYLYDWLSCIANGKSEICRSLKEKEKEAEVLKVANFYLSLFVKLGFLIKNGKKYRLGKVCWTIHQHTGVISFSPFESSPNKTITIDQNRDSITVFDRYIEFTPPKFEMAHILPCGSTFPLGGLPLYYNSKKDLFLELTRQESKEIAAEKLKTPDSFSNRFISRDGYAWNRQFTSKIFTAGQSFYVMNYYLDEYLDLQALHFYYSELNSKMCFINRSPFLDYYTRIDKYNQILLTRILTPNCEN